MPNVDEIREVCRRTRKTAGYTLNDVAKQIGLSVSSISRWERGLTKLQDNQIAKIAEILGRAILTAKGVSREWVRGLTDVHGNEVSIVAFILGEAELLRRNAEVEWPDPEPGFEHYPGMACRETRENHNISQLELARESKINRVIVSKYENNKLPKTQKKRVGKILTLAMSRLITRRAVNVAMLEAAANVIKKNPGKLN